MLINQLLKNIKTALQAEYTSEHAYSLAWIILEHITQKSRTQLLLANNIILSESQQKELKTILKKHIEEHKPLQYLLKSVEFIDLTLYVEPPILIPRRETEAWCFDLITQLSILRDHSFTILDLCTGTGCIALSLAQAFKHAQIWAIDINPKAITLAQKNATLNNINNVTFLVADLYNKLPKDLTFDLIVSNPPYIDYKEWQTLEPRVKQWEDIDALVATNKGLDIIKQIAYKAHNWLNYRADFLEKDIPQLALEIGHNQGESVKKILTQFNYSNIKILKDITNNNRIAYANVTKDL